MWGFLTRWQNDSADISGYTFTLQSHEYRYILSICRDYGKRCIHIVNHAQCHTRRSRLHHDVTIVCRFKISSNFKMSSVSLQSNACNNDYNSSCECLCAVSVAVTVNVQSPSCLRIWPYCQSRLCRASAPSM